LQNNRQLKQQKKAFCEAKAGPGKKSLAFLFEEMNALKRQLMPEKSANSKKRKDKTECISCYLLKLVQPLRVMKMKVRSTHLLLLNPLALAKPS
jgi:hypothetical protein